MAGDLEKKVRDLVRLLDAKDFDGFTRAAIGDVRVLTNYPATGCGAEERFKTTSSSSVRS